MAGPKQEKQKFVARPVTRKNMTATESSIRNRYQETLLDVTRELVAHATLVDVADPHAHDAARDAFMTSLQTHATALGLVFERVSPNSAQVDLPADPPSPDAKVIGFLGHGDIRPPEPGWTVDPFAAPVVDGRVFGQGSLDDKGPLVAVLVAMAAARDSRAARPVVTRLVVGMAKELDGSCMKEYLAAKRPPDFTMVLDGTFPVGVGEKGVVSLKVAQRFSAASSAGHCTLKRLEGGSSGNVVPDSAKALLECPGMAAEVAASLTSAASQVDVDGDRITITTLGRTAHGSAPEQGINALHGLLQSLDTFGRLDDAQPGVLLLRFLASHAVDVGGQPLGLRRTHAGYSPTSVNLGRLSFHGNLGLASLSVRMPPPTMPEELVTATRRAADAFALSHGQAGALIVEGSGEPGVDVDPARPEVQAIQRAYTRVFEKPATPYTLAASSYARTLPNAVLFGPVPEGAVDRRHVPDESITMEELVMLATTYAQAVLELASVTPSQNSAAQTPP